MIELRGVTVRYPGATSDALRDCSCAFPPGSITAIMGANGSGKSTLARVLSGLLAVDRGEVLLDEVRMTAPGAVPLLRRTVGLVFQRPHQQITSVSVERELAFGLENLALPPADIRRRVEEALETFGLGHLREELPGSLAGGELQRLAVASILVMAPRYLVLDEPTSFLSPSSRRMVLDLAARHRSEHGTGILLITQFPEEAMEAEHLLLLQEGRLVREGPPGELFADTDGMDAVGVRVPRS